MLFKKVVDKGLSLELNTPFNFQLGISSAPCFVSLDIIPMLKLVRLLSKSVSVNKLAYFNLAEKLSAVNLLNSGVVIFLSWWGTLFLTPLIFVFKRVVVDQPLVCDIYLSTSSTLFSCVVLIYMN